MAIVRRARLLALVLLAAPAAGAQPRTADPIKRGLQLSDFPRVVKLAENVYGYEEIRQPGFTTVSLIVVGRNGVLIADAQGSAQATQIGKPSRRTQYHQARSPHPRVQSLHIISASGHCGKTVPVSWQWFGD